MILSLLACGTPGDQSVDEALWERIQGYQDWDQLDPWVGIQETEAMHADFVQVWVSPEWLASTAEDAAEDAIAVKRGYADAQGAEELSLTVMWKTSTVELLETGWYWASFNSEGKASASGEPGACTGCHTDGDDWRMILVSEPK